MAPGTILGRDNELAAIAQAIDGGPFPRALQLEGVAGIGKTTLWRSSTRRLAERGHVLEATAS